MNKIGILAIIGVFAAVIGGFSYISRDAAPIREIDTIVALGDSLTQGYGSTKGNDYVSRLKNMEGMTDKTIINMGEGGDTSSGVLARVDDAVEKDPDLVILFIGGNDVLRRVSKEEMYANIEAIISKLKGQGIEVALVGVPGGFITDPFDTIFERIADKHDAVYIPEFMGKLIRSREYMFDSVHPNDAGYAIIAEKIYEGIEDLIGK